MFITEYAKKFIGRQETAGPNRGPLVDKWKAAISTFLAPKPIPWCACFGYAMLAEVSGLTKKAIAKELGVKIEWQETAFAQMISSLQTGRVDIAMAGMSASNAGNSRLARRAQKDERAMRPVSRCSASKRDVIRTRRARRRGRRRESHPAARRSRGREARPRRATPRSPSSAGT